jgi:predicted amidohydrolase YtcJ
MTMAKVLLAGGDVIDVRTGTRDRNDVLLDGQHIAGVGRAAEFGAASDATRLDVKGQTILPGFSNNHVHVGWSGMGWDGGRDQRHQGRRQFAEVAPRRPHLAS